MMHRQQRFKEYEIIKWEDRAEVGGRKKINWLGLNECSEKHNVCDLAVRLRHALHLWWRLPVFLQWVDKRLPWLGLVEVVLSAHVVRVELDFSGHCNSVNEQDYICLSQSWKSVIHYLKDYRKPPAQTQCLSWPQCYAGTHAFFRTQTRLWTGYSLFSRLSPPTPF